jgi:hypothetical protein
LESRKKTIPSTAPTSTHSPDWQKLDFRQATGRAPLADLIDGSAAAGALCPADSFSQRDIELFIAFLEWISCWPLSCPPPYRAETCRFERSRAAIFS